MSTFGHESERGCVSKKRLVGVELSLTSDPPAREGAREDFMPDKFWKAIERRVARMFGTERIGTREGGQAPDWENDWTVGEVVCHPIPAWILKELAQAERRRTDHDKLRLLVIHEKGQDLDEALVVMRLGQFTDWFLGDTSDKPHSQIRDPGAKTDAAVLLGPRQG
jgi:hypothetical protein